ncbi:hypothetical protein N182_24755 [Sinorhizobium sp. GL2]|nr:hypothetical protein N182_24755 [Sinorhizobium sp. GL2]
MAKVHRFSAGLTETLVGPAAEAIADFAELGLKARDAGFLTDAEKVRLADYLNWGLWNTPLINLFYVRPALDYLILNSIREVASPGYLKRSRKRDADFTGRREDVKYWNRDRKDGGVW